MKPEFEDKTKPNLKVLQEFRIKGAAQPKGSVIAKSAFPAKQDWMNLLHMAKPRVEETADKVAKAKAMPGT